MEGRHIQKISDLTEAQNQGVLVNEQRLAGLGQIIIVPDQRPDNGNKIAAKVIVCL